MIYFILLIPYELGTSEKQSIYPVQNAGRIHSFAFYLFFYLFISYTMQWSNSKRMLLHFSLKDSSNENGKEICCKLFIKDISLIGMHFKVSDFYLSMFCCIKNPMDLLMNS